MSTRVCTKCSQEKELEAFPLRADRAKDGSRRRRGHCKICHSDYFRERTYGVNRAAYDEMLEAQNGACAICGTKEPGSKRKHFHVDHCHRTNKIRGLLCGNCNLGMGNLQDDIEILIRAIEYLREKS